MCSPVKSIHYVLFFVVAMPMTCSSPAILLLPLLLRQGFSTLPAHSDSCRMKSFISISAALVILSAAQDLTPEQLVAQCAPCDSCFEGDVACLTPGMDATYSCKALPSCLACIDCAPFHGANAVAQDPSSYRPMCTGHHESALAPFQASLGAACDACKPCGPFFGSDGSAQHMPGCAPHKICEYVAMLLPAQDTTLLTQAPSRHSQRAIQNQIVRSYFALSLFVRRFQRKVPLSCATIPQDVRPEHEQQQWSLCGLKLKLVNDKIRMLFSI